jgi:hypothetical protein
MPQSNAIQQVFNPATQRTLLRIGLFLAVGLGLDADRGVRGAAGQKTGGER